MMMKKIMMMLLGLVFTSALQAQISTGKTVDRAQQERGEKMTPEEHAKKKLAKMTDALELDEKQQKQVYAIVLEQAQQKERHRVQREEMRKQAMASREKSETRLAEVLTPEQRKKWEAHKAERKEKLNERRQGDGKQHQKLERSRELDRNRLEQTR